MPLESLDVRRKRVARVIYDSVPTNNKQFTKEIHLSQLANQNITTGGNNIRSNSNALKSRKNILDRQNSVSMIKIKDDKNL